MARIALVQDNLDIKKMIRILLSESETNLTRVCEKHGLEYSRIDKKNKAKMVYLDYLTDLIHKINPEAEITTDINFTVVVGGKEIFNQKIKK